MATATRTKVIDQLKAAAAQPPETRRGNEIAAQRITVANQLIRGTITPSQAKRKI
jgi:hypothetical protein